MIGGNYIALQGDGDNGELSEEQLDMVNLLFDLTKPLRDELISVKPSEKEICDHEMCRRYLVARRWKQDAALKQLESTLTWRMDQQNNPGFNLDFWQSPKAIANPHSMNFRCVGLDKGEHPVLYTCFAEAHDRFDVDAATVHVSLLTEACMNLIQKRSFQGFNKIADSRQCVWVIDFDGFGFRDNNPKMGIKMSRLLMQHYPETLNLVICVNAPKLFSAFWRVLRPILDDKLRSKVLFLSGNATTMKNLLDDKLGSEASKWILDEMEDNVLKREKGAACLKKYWAAPENKSDHNPRGFPLYVGSEWYIKTPGDAYEELKQKQ